MTPVKHSKVNLYDFFFANKTRKTYTHIGVSLTLVIVLLVFALRPTILTIGVIKEKIAEYEDLNTKLEKKIAASRNLQQELSQSSSASAGGLKDEITFMNRTYQVNDNIKDVYQNLYTRSLQHSVAIKSLSPRSIAESSNTTFEGSALSPSVLSYEVSMELEAKDMVTAENFVRSLESYTLFPIPSRVKSVVINNLVETANLGTSQGTDAVSASKIIAMNITLVVYVDQTRITPVE